ncbi:hypothetical protein PG990_010980 [Apiospora arundinis]
MARKGTKKGRQNYDRITWDTFKDEIPLLAWLDYCIQYGVDFDSTIVDHLRTYANKEVNLKKVNDKLKRLWDNCGYCDKFDDFKNRQGSPAIGITSIERKAVEKFKESLPPPPARPDTVYLLQGITPGLRTRSRTLSAQRQASEDSSLSDLSSITDPDDCSDANARDEIVDCSEQMPKAKKRRIEVSLSIPVSLPAGEVPDAYSKEVPQPRIVRNRPDGKSIVSRETQTTPIRHGVEDDTSYSRLQSGFIHGERRINQMRSEVVTLAGRLHEARQERDELLHCARAAEGAEDKTGMLVSLQHENVVLKKQLLAFQEARENKARWRTGSLGPSDHEIGAELGVIESSIADACASLQWDGLLLDQPKGEPRAADMMLSQWANTLSGSDFSCFMASCGGSSRVKTVDALGSLVAAALWSLVWQHPLDEIVNAESPILDYYKKQLLVRDGPEALHHIELLAYKALISHPHFDGHLVAGRSQVLSEYICHVLEPLFSGEPAPGRAGGSEAAVVSPDATPAALFEDAVQRALHLAAKLYLTDRWCLWHFAQPGCRFDALTMVVAGQAAVHSSTEEPMVQLCIFPALYMSKTPKGPRSYEMNEGAGIRGPENLRDYKLVAKSVVVV